MLSKKPNRILKAGSARNLDETILFKYDDFQHECRLHVEKANQRARQIIEDAQAESQTIRQRAFDEATAAGVAEVESGVESRAAVLADQLVAERIGTLLPALQQTSEKLSREYNRWLAHWEESAARLCVGIAEKLIRHELEMQPETANDMIAEALRLAVGQPTVTVRMNPADFERLGNDAETFVKSVTSCAQVTVLADQSIDCGGCKIETQHGQIDACLQTLLERITAELIV